MFVTNLQGVPADQGVIEGDSILLGVLFSPEFIGSVQGFANPFIPSAYATSCSPDGGLGLKDPLTAFTLTSNEKFNDFEAGTSLNEILSVYGEKTIEEWLADADTWEFEYMSRANIVITEKPVDIAIRKFQIKMIFESGIVLEKESEVIQWE
ncbi:MAG: hypothetical protein DHS20C18_18070 [Saprospiraceae bacterium]|nr:MAG: hypothetical protein DHS20C18_18070 [Saprospiraceae bacterium]